MRCTGLNRLFCEDYYRMTGKKWGITSWIDLFLRYDLKYLRYLRKRKKNKMSAIRAMRWNRKHGLEILSYQIGKGLYLGHAHNITVNPNAVIGDNCNLNKGSTIGAENRGQRKGAPTLGNRVWIGTNAVVVGQIIIEDDVLIAPNSFVNIDVPSHSVVIGNPAMIYPRNNATEGYVCNEV